jgi:transposase
MAICVRAPAVEGRAKLRRLVRSHRSPVRLVRRPRIILRSAQGETAPAIARDLGLAERTVRLWLQRFTPAGLDGLDDAPRSGRPRA